MGIKRYHLLISGRVQGVGYRYFVQQQAEALNLKGWTRNLSDGHVEVLVEAEKSAFTAFLQKCKIGPQFSQVEKVVVKESDAQNSFTHFSISPSV